MTTEQRSQQATIGCGSLILIALIVLFFSRPGIGELEREVGSLKLEVRKLKKSIELQTDELRVLQEKIGKGQK